jgi:hypothetical protein
MKYKINIVFLCFLLFYSLSAKPSLLKTDWVDGVHLSLLVNTKSELKREYTICKTQEATPLVCNKTVSKQSLDLTQLRQQLKTYCSLKQGQKIMINIGLFTLELFVFARVAVGVVTAVGVGFASGVSADYLVDTFILGDYQKECDMAEGTLSEIETLYFSGVSLSQIMKVLKNNVEEESELPDEAKDYLLSRGILW